MSELVIGGRTFRSRLFVGTGKFSSNELMARAIAASESEMVTVAMKRIDMNNPQDDMLVHVRRPEIQLLPNTSGVRDAEEAVLAAQLAREAFGTNFIKRTHLGSLDAGQLDDTGREGNAGIDEFGEFVPRNAVLDDERADLDNAVLVGIGTGRFQIYRDNHWVH